MYYATQQGIDATPLKIFIPYNKNNKIILYSVTPVTTIKRKKDNNKFYANNVYKLNHKVNLTSFTQITNIYKQKNGKEHIAVEM